MADARSGVGGTFSVGYALSEGWRVMSENYGVFLGASVVYMLLTIVIGIIPILGAIASFFLVPPLMAGWLFMGIKAYRGRVEFGDLWCGFQRYWSILGIYVLTGLLTFAACIPAGLCALAGMGIDKDMEGIGPIVLGIGCVITFVLVVIISLRFCFSMSICIDRGFRAVDAMRASWRVTAPYVFGILGLGIVMLLINGVLMVLLVLPMIFLGMPLGMGVTGAMFNLIVPAPQAAHGESAEGTDLDRSPSV